MGKSFNVYMEHLQQWIVVFVNLHSAYNTLVEVSKSKRALANNTFEFSKYEKCLQLAVNEAPLSIYDRLNLSRWKFALNGNNRGVLTLRPTRNEEEKFSVGDLKLQVDKFVLNHPQTFLAKIILLYFKMESILIGVTEKRFLEPNQLSLERYYLEITGVLIAYIDFIEALKIISFKQADSHVLNINQYFANKPNISAQLRESMVAFQNITRLEMTFMTGIKELYPEDDNSDENYLKAIIDFLDNNKGESIVVTPKYMLYQLALFYKKIPQRTNSALSQAHD